VIELRSITAGGLREASFALGAGGSCRLLLASEADLTLLLQLMIGTAHPAAGQVLLLGRDLAETDDRQTLALLARTGIVWPGGGFVSNLKTWENLLLPLWYHGDGKAARREAEVVALLGSCGMEADRIPGFLAALPGSLPTREQRILGTVRAMLMDAELMVYAGLFEGLDGPTRSRLLAATARHHARREGRASLFVAADPQGLPDPFDGVSLRQEAGGGIARWP
jgi:phospholipid/cholesterol/gamma-HCH transport system ATP-binding protein